MGNRAQAAPGPRGEGKLEPRGREPRRFPASVARFGACVAAGLALALMTATAPAFASSGPAVNAVWPRSGPLAGGTVITVEGAGFTGATAVTVAGVPATGFDLVSDTVLRVTAASSDVATSGAVIVTAPSGVSSPSPLNSYAYRVGGTSIMVPSYISPGTAWSQIDASRPPVDLAIINPASGPGNTRDSNYAAQVVSSENAGVDVVGYVHTSYGARSLKTVENEISEYENWYHLDGIFVDEVDTSCSLEASYYAPLYAFIHAQAGLDLAILNPGEATNQCYMAAADVVLGFEGTPSQLASAGRPPSWMAAFAPGRFWAVVYGASGVSTERSVLATLASEGFGEVYVTDKNLPNPYGALPSYWSTEVADASGAPAGSGLAPQTVTFTSTPPAPASVGAKYVVGATGGASGLPVVLTVDASSAGSCTINAKTVTFVAAGTCVIDADQAGNDSFAAAAEVQQQITVTSAPATSAPVITSASGFTAPAGQTFSFTFTATGTPVPTVKTSSSLPSGVRFVSNGDGTATLSGSVRRSRTYRLTISATNGVGRGASQTFTLTIS